MGGGGQHPEVPDYKIYKVKGISRLEELQSRLAAKGLKDPWIRNEVWKFTPNNYLSPAQTFRHMTWPVKWGVAAFLLTVFLDKTTGFLYPKKQEHH